eukprot:1575110-Pleurochrysis_carterae.AAC.1
MVEARRDDPGLANNGRVLRTFGETRRGWHRCRTLSLYAWRECRARRTHKMRLFVSGPRLFLRAAAGEAFGCRV